MTNPLIFVLGTLMAASAIAGDCSSEEGSRSFSSKCGICHVAEAGATPTVGPNLHGVFGRPRGTASGFTYSTAMRDAGGTWTGDRLDQFLKAPQQAIPGNAMPFQGMRSEVERRHIICFLQALGRP